MNTGDSGSSQDNTMHSNQQMQSHISNSHANLSSGQSILVTGGVGYIGSHTVVELCKQYPTCQIVIIDDLRNSNQVALQRVKQITGSGKIKFIKANMNSEDTLDGIFTQFKPSAVIHFAGLKAVGESVKKPLEYYDNNVSGTITLLRVMRMHNCNLIVFSSSACVYGENPLCKETDSIGSLNPYGQTKSMIE